MNTNRSTSAGIAVECHEVSKFFGSGEHCNAVLRELSLEIPFGMFTMIAGPSGCGKTTLLSIIAGLLSPSCGSVSVLGQAMEELSEDELVKFRRRHLGFVFQEYHLVEALTAAENVATPLIAAGMKFKEARARGAQILAELDMERYANALPAVLSGGQKQRVAIGRALIHNPSLILCDEPTAALDHKTGMAVVQTLRTVAKTASRAVVVVTHDTRLFAFADFIAHMDDGKIVEFERRVTQ